MRAALTLDKCSELRRWRRGESTDWLHLGVLAALLLGIVACMGRAPDCVLLRYFGLLVITLSAKVECHRKTMKMKV